MSGWNKRESHDFPRPVLILNQKSQGSHMLEKPLKVQPFSSIWSALNWHWTEALTPSTPLLQSGSSTMPCCGDWNHMFSPSSSKYALVCVVEHGGR